MPFSTSARVLAVRYMHTPRPYSEKWMCHHSSFIFSLAWGVGAQTGPVGAARVSGPPAPSSPTQWRGPLWAAQAPPSGSRHMGLPAEAWDRWGQHCPWSALARGVVKAQNHRLADPDAWVSSAMEPCSWLTPLAPRSSMGVFPWKSLSRPW